MKLELYEWYRRKGWVADGFAALHFADSITLSAGEIKKLSLCLSLLNDYLNNDCPDK